MKEEHHGRVASGVEEGGGGSLPLSPLPPGLLTARDSGGIRFTNSEFLPNNL